MPIKPDNSLSKPLLEAPQDLLTKVLNRLEKERKIAIFKRRVAILTLTTAGSIIALVPALNVVRLRFIESGFLQFFSLIFSDSEIIYRQWQNFVLTLLETLPIMSLTIFLAILLIFLESLKFLIKNVKNIKAQSNFL